MKLELRNISCGYEGKSILENVNLSLHTGEIACILGPNGIGKTTLFKTILGLNKPLQGGVFINEENINLISAKRRAELLAYVPQNSDILFPYKVIDIVLMGINSKLSFYSSPSDSDYETAGKILKHLSINRYENQVFGKLSGGEKQLVLIARALCQEPKFLILDEPASSLDFGNQAAIFSEITDLVKKDMGILMTTHSPNHTFQTGGKVILINRQKEILTGTAEEIITEENIEKTYGVKSKISDSISDSGEKVKFCIPLNTKKADKTRNKKKQKLLSLIIMMSLFLPGIFSVLKAEETVNINDESTKEETDQDSTNSVMLDQIQIKYKRDPHRKYNITIPVTNIDKEYLNENMFISMADLLDSVPGFSTLYEYHSPVYMRGFAGNNILFIQDGCRRISTAPQGTRANKLNAFNIEEIEIIKGPGSVLYGSGALTGIVNIKTKDIFKRPGFSAEIKSDYAANSNEKDNACMVNYNAGFAALNLSARRRTSGNYTLPDGTETEHSYLEENDFTGKAGIKPSENQKIIFSTDIHLGGPWSKAAGFNGKQNMQIYYDREDAYHFSLFYEITDFLSLNALQINTFFDHEKTNYGQRWYSVFGPVTSDDKTNMTDNYGGADLFIEKSFGSNMIAAGIDSTFFRIWIDTSAYSTLLGPQPYYSESDSIQGGGTDNIGAFVQDKLRLGKIEFVFGIRYDAAKVTEGGHHAESLDEAEGYSPEKEKTAFSGNAGFLYRIFRDTSWSFNIGRAFRMPNYSEAYSETVTGKGVISGNPEIRPEYSYNIDTGINGIVSYLNFGFDAFINFYDDLISTELKDSKDSSSGYIYRNVNAARIYGFESELSYNFINTIANNSVLTPSAAWTYYVGDKLPNGDYTNFSGGTPLSYIPNSEINSSLRFTRQFSNFRLFSELGGTYAFRQERVPEGFEPFESYYFIEFKTGVATDSLWFFENIKIYLTVKNLTNNEYHVLGGYLPAKGRDVRISLDAKI